MCSHNCGLVIQMDDQPVSPIPSHSLLPSPDCLTFNRKTRTPTSYNRKAPPRPIKSASSVRRLFAHDSNPCDYSDKPHTVSFKSDLINNSIIGSGYDESRTESYFEQVFEIQKKIGSGYFGDVFSVRSRRDGEVYAVKRSREHFKGKCDRFRKLQEVEKHERLPKHPNLVEFFNAWEEEQRLFIQIELCDYSLSDLSNKYKDIPEPHVWNVLSDILMALHHLHQHNLIHLDVKPENIFVSRGICKLGDFGLVVDLDQDAGQAVEGDPKYMAKELMQGAAAFTKAADIFSLGMTVLELACDIDIPSSGPGFHALRSGSIPFASFGAHLSDDLKEIITSMMHPDPYQRPNAEQLLKHPVIRGLAKKRKLKAEVNQVIKKIRSFFVLLFHWLMMILVAIFKFSLHTEDSKNAMPDSPPFADDFARIHLDPGFSDDDEFFPKVTNPHQSAKTKYFQSSIPACESREMFQEKRNSFFSTANRLASPVRSSRRFMSSTPLVMTQNRTNPRIGSRGNFHSYLSDNLINSSACRSKSVYDFSDFEEDVEEDVETSVSETSIGPKNLLTVFDQMEDDSDDGQ